MKVLTVRNVNEALWRGVELMLEGKEMGHVNAQDSRGGPTLEYMHPVATTYRRPAERVLFSACRDANPFFHLMESLWILACRQDVAFLSYFNQRMADYSDDGTSFHGAYGARMGRQLYQVINLLREDPGTRRAVLQIWDHELDLEHDGLDLPCNDLIFLKIRHGFLHMRVCCRSNDMIWGAYGANAVQFSMLLEWLAAHTGYEIGTYTQISDSFHVYTEGPGGEVWRRLSRVYREADYTASKLITAAEQDVHLHPRVPLADDGDITMFDGDRSTFFYHWDHGIPVESGAYRSRFFNEVVLPMYLAWGQWKYTHDPALAIQVLDEAIQYQAHSPDWVEAGRRWLMMRR